MEEKAAEQTQTIDDDEGAPFDYEDVVACAERVQQWKQRYSQMDKLLSAFREWLIENTFDRPERENIMSLLEIASEDMIEMHRDVEGAFKKMHAHKAEALKFKELYHDSRVDIRVLEGENKALIEEQRIATNKERKILNTFLIFMYTAMGFYFLAKCASH